MMKSILAVPLLVAAAHVGHAAQGADEPTDRQRVAEVVKTAVDKVMLVLQDAELPRQDKRERVMKVIEPVIDFELLAMLSLGKTYWSRIDAKQRQAFTELFVETLKLSYFEKLELFSDEVVEFEEPVPIETTGSPKYFVLSSIVSKGNRVKVGYSLTRRGEVWKVYDFEIEGVSIRKSYGSQYNDFLREGSFEKLLATMREKVDEAKAKDADSSRRSEH
jgi:phospholipid transport system substrate-binding protein